MTRILSKQIENLSPEIQVEVLQYVESLLKRKKSHPSDAPQRMTLDRFQEYRSTGAQESNVHHEAIHYTIW